MGITTIKSRKGQGGKNNKEDGRRVYSEEEWNKKKQRINRKKTPARKKTGDSSRNIQYVSNTQSVATKLASERRLALAMRQTHCLRGCVGAGETPHTCRKTNLLATRFQSVLNLGSTEVFFVLCGFDEGGTATPVGVSNASFHPDGRSKTGSSPMSRDLMEIRTSASSSSESQVVVAAVFSAR